MSNNKKDTKLSLGFWISIAGIGLIIGVITPIIKFKILLFLSLGLALVMGGIFHEINKTKSHIYSNSEN